MEISIPYMSGCSTEFHLEPTEGDVQSLVDDVYKQGVIDALMFISNLSALGGLLSKRDRVTLLNIAIDRIDEVDGEIEEAKFEALRAINLGITNQKDQYLWSNGEHKKKEVKNGQ